MADTKTKPTNVTVADFLATVSEKRQAEASVIIDMMSRASGQPPVMWGPSIIGFGNYHYKYASGHEGDAPRIGFSPRKAAISLYLTYDFDEIADELAEFGKYTTGKACIYVRKLDDINLDVLRRMIEKSYESSGDYDATNN